METVQIVLDKKLLRAADQTARRTKQNRSALVRAALRAYISKLEIRALEEQEREAYRKRPQTREEAFLWPKEGVWPDD